MGARRRVSKHIIMLGSLGALVTLAACNNDDEVITNIVAPVPVATTLRVNDSTNNQSALAGGALAAPISVRVFDESGVAMPNAVVSWSVTSGSGVLSAATTVTDASGDASVTWILGNASGQQLAEATLANGASAVFIATANAGAFANLVIVAGDGQTVLSGAETAPMIVRAVDEHGNGVAGVVISWTTSDGGVLSAVSSTTDASGQAQVTLTPSGQATYVVTAQSGPVFVNFTGTGG